MVFVTGATGFLGAHLVAHLLQQGESVKAMHRKTSSFAQFNYILGLYDGAQDAAATRLEWSVGDLLDLEYLENILVGVKQVYHTAGFVSFDKRKSKGINKINSLGTANLINACLDVPGIKLVHVSSIAALGNAIALEDIDENSVRSANSHYGIYSRSKFNGEREVWRGIAEGLNAVIVNPGIILGPGTWNLGSPLFFSTIWAGMPFYTDGQTGYIDVRDVAEICIHLMNSDIQSERYVLVTENMSYKQLFDLIADALGKKRPSLKVNFFALYLAYMLESIYTYFNNNEPRISNETLKAAQNKQSYTNQKLLKIYPQALRPVQSSIGFTAGHFLDTMLKQKKLKTKQV